MQATQGSSLVLQRSRVAIMSHLKPFSPAMACERQPLSKLPLEARTMIEAYCQLPPKTSTAELIDAKIQLHWKYFKGTMLRYVGKDIGFMKYLNNNFVLSQGSSWRRCYTHRKLGHRLFFKYVGYETWSCYVAIDSDGNSFKYPGLERMRVSW